MTQNETSKNFSNAPERFLSLIADGASQFTHSKNIALCQKCVRSNTRKRVVVETQLATKKFFILAEFPESEDELSADVFSEKSNANIILNLIKKLEIENECHYSFALKCVSQKHIPEDHLSLCVVENLRYELRCVMPRVIFCFGARSFFALSQFVVSLNNVTVKSSMLCEFEKNQIEIYMLPTVQELTQHPHWRPSVWSKLLHFKQKKNIAS